MTPDLGRGACEALVDAVALADCLAHSSTVEEGLRAYDQRRRRTTTRLALASATAGRLTRARRLPRLREALLKLALRAPVPD
jgi:2-polyprenyl-6-methoxyphenol hydroxylase-like FAD-dependent oxidoreductase